MLTLRTTLPRTKYLDPEKRIGFYHRVLQGVRTLPGVESAGYGSMLPFRSQGNTQSYRVEGRERVPGDAGDALLRVTSGDYLQTLGVRLVEGRLLQASDTDQSATGDGDQRDAGASLLPEGKRAGPPHRHVGRERRCGEPSSAWCTTSTSAATNSP